ncbi:MAG: ASKHA domain-containing protein [Lachnospiraceae bacterium]|nr:ASKHA domain-containing protein [Lachnospiraceae bacterium]
MFNGITRKIYVELAPPTEQDNTSAERRILSALEAALQSEREQSGCHLVTMPLPIMRKLHPMCETAAWKLTASLAWDGCRWEMVALEAGDTSMHHYGLAVDLGSTTLVMQLVDCNTGEVVLQEGAYNQQIAYGEDILMRIFYSKDNPEHLEEIRLATVNTIVELMKRLEEKTGIPLRTDLRKAADACEKMGLTGDNPLAGQCISMVVAGNTTMTHFLLGLDAFCVFSAPYAVQTDQPGFIRGRDLDIPVTGYVYCYPSRANYLGGDIISGMVATGMYRKKSISLFFDVGTNGELVVGNRDFLLCGAGAAGPALEGGVVKTGMRAADGAVQHVRFVRADKCTKNFTTFLIGRNTYMAELDVIGGGAPKGICGSGIVDLISELFLYGIVDLRGRLVPEASDAVVWSVPGESGQEDSRPEDFAEYSFRYAPGLSFYQSDISEFIRTKAAAYTMMEYLLSETGMTLDDVRDFHMAGAFGTHVNKESAINIGMYPDVEPERIHAEGNTSLEGAKRLLLDRSITEELPDILDLMTYVQFGAVEDFLEKMTAASALPHTDIERYPSVKARLMKKLVKVLEE